MIALLGEISHVWALANTQYPMIRIGDGAPQQRRTFDHLLVQARLASGAVASIEVIGGRPAGTPFKLKIVGDHGTLRLDGGAPCGFQAGLLQLSLNGVPDDARATGSDLLEGAGNVAGMAVRDAMPFERQP